MGCTGLPASLLVHSHAKVHLILCPAAPSFPGKVQTAREAQHALALSSPLLAKLEAEAGLLASLRHPYIVSFCELANSHGRRGGPVGWVLGCRQPQQQPQQQPQWQLSRGWRLTE